MKNFKVEAPGFRTRACSSLKAAEGVVKRMRVAHNRNPVFPPFCAAKSTFKAKIFFWDGSHFKLLYDEDKRK